MVIDLSNAHVWDASSGAALYGRLAGQLSGGH